MKKAKEPSWPKLVIPAYLGVVLIWSTTPLAISWSTEAAGFVFGLASRMVIGLSVLSIILLLLRHRFIWHAPALRVYFYSGLGIYSSMMMVYWSAQYIPSGWIGLLFGFTPVFSALMASVMLHNEPLNRFRILGIGVALTGLAIVLRHSLNWQPQAVWGIAGVLLSGLLHSLSSVMVKRVDVRLPAMTLTAGSLLCATPLFVLSWLSIQPGWHESWHAVLAAPPHALLSILYLSVFGSVLGFSLYYYVLQRVSATRTALISLITPVISLLLGHLLNNETLTMNILIGGLLILSGLAVFEFGPHWRAQAAGSH